MSKLLIALIVVVVLITLSFLLPVKEWFESFNLWVQDLGAVGYLVFGIVYILATILFLPGSVLTLGAGVLFGVVKGALLVSVSATTGATLAFLIARYGMRQTVVAKFGHNRRFRAIDTAIGQKGAKIILMLRLSPVFLFNALNYLLGLTAVRFKDYVLASWIGMIPGTVLYVYLGYAAKVGLEAAASEQGQDPLQLTYLTLGLLVTVAVTVYVTRLARKALKENKLGLQGVA